MKVNLNDEIRIKLVENGVILSHIFEDFDVDGTATMREVSVVLETDPKFRYDAQEYSRFIERVLKHVSVQFGVNNNQKKDVVKGLF